jgi:hypothetical protein
MGFGRWNVRNLYRTDLLMTVAKEASKYKLYLVGVQEVRLGRGGTEPANKLHFSMERVMRNVNWGQVFCT